MSNAAFNSSDSVRSAKPLRYAHYARLADRLSLELGGELSAVTVCYETYGTLAPDGGNAVLVCHALSGDSHVAPHDAADDPGWWDIAVGPGKPIDTDQYFVICPNLLGGCRGTTGPNTVNPATGRPYGPDFPPITIGDMVEVQRRLIEHLGIRQLLAVVGGSMGGHLVQAWAIRHPDLCRGAIALATSPRVTTQSLAFDVVGRNAILHDPNFHGGQYYGKGSGPSSGLAIARMIGHITYLSGEAMQRKFEADRYQPRDVPTTFEKAFSVGSYLGYQGHKFVERFDANSYILLTKAMDLFDLGGSPAALSRAYSSSRCRWLVVSFSSDWLFPPFQSQEMVAALIAGGKPVSYCNVPSQCGHDAFLLEDDLPLYGGLMQAFLDNLLHPRCCEKGKCCLGTTPSGAPSELADLIRPPRRDFDRLVGLIPVGTSVLDLGCGEGGLLCRLRQRGQANVMGLDVDEESILECVRHGQNVIHADLNRHLAQFADGQFDYVVLSLTLQAVKDVEGVLAEMLRIGRHGVVSFPNFAYHKLRRMLWEQGRAPESTGQLRHKWYNTPNLRFFSIEDFEELCREKGITVRRRLALDTEAGKEVRKDPNLYADLAIFVISR